MLNIVYTLQFSGQRRLTHISHQRHNIYRICFIVILSLYIFIDVFTSCVYIFFADHLQTESIATTT